MRASVMAGSLVAVILIGCGGEPVDEGARQISGNGGVQQIICIDGINCGGCGTLGEVHRLMAGCYGKGPTGPCFSDCWNPCMQRASHSQSPNPIACTMDCMYKSCPNAAATPGVKRIGPASCPKSDPNVICTMIYAPTDCGGCIYGSACFATAAGFDPTLECSPLY